jgi:YgiT-type zinc finger domain-containing protein
MKCVVCKNGETTDDGTVTVTLERGCAVLVVKSVPARVCSVCGEEYVDEAVMERLMHTADEAAKSGVQFDVRDFAAA